MRDWLVVRISLGVALGTGGCSFLVDASDPQCETNAECIDAKLGSRCERRVCVGNPPAQCRGAACEMTSGVGAAGTSSPSDGSCVRDSQCPAATPRCMRGTCVTEAIAERWLCPPVEERAESDVIHYSFRVIEFVSRMSPGHVVALACRTNDPTCTNPVDRFEDETGDGLVELELPVGWSGFVEVQSDALPALSYLTKPLTQDLRDRDLQVSSMSTLELLATLDQTVFEPEKGIALVEAFDCTGTPSGGVHFQESKGTSKPFYIVNHVPNSDATVSVYDEVNGVADGGFINVEPGFVTFTARWGVDGPVLGEFNAHVRASTITFVDMYF